MTCFFKFGSCGDAQFLLGLKLTKFGNLSLNDGVFSRHLNNRFRHETVNVKSGI